MFVKFHLERFPGFKGISAHKGNLVPGNITKKWYFVIVEEKWKSIIILNERRKRGRVRTGPSDPKRTKGSLRCMASIDRSTHPPSFIRRTRCNTSLEFPGRCQLLSHTIKQANRASRSIIDNEVPTFIDINWYFFGIHKWFVYINKWF